MIKLQTILGHQDEDIANLSKELYTQQQELNKLKQQVAMLVERINPLLESAHNALDKAPEPPPPHY